MASRRSEERQRAVLDAALAVLERQGYAGTSMLDIAREARASKETLYAWFGDKRGLFAALVADNAAAVNAVIEAMPNGPAETPIVDVLSEFGAALLTLLLGPRAIAINRAAAAEAARDGELGRLLVASGRAATGGRMVALLRDRAARGDIEIDDPEEAFSVFLGLLLRDLQIQVLVGAMPAPDDEGLRRRAETAADLFLRLYGRQRG
ncbi:TetR/AcrR family transcriptional regulator [Inquilinus sp.]|jgi:TetR/AcrR family transcriptional repressor of mexJK operon|uniref:TetR/AcrR family transcriptional regulator n=1 Tax=Inquilinus sp. TaxID=1932117 RepID=UPI0037849593